MSKLAITLKWAYSFGAISSEGTKKKKVKVVGGLCNTTQHELPINCTSILGMTCLGNHGLITLFHCI